MFFQELALFIILTSASAQDLECYQCNPWSTGNCESLDHATSTICSETSKPANSDDMLITTEIIKMGENSTEPFCFFLNYNFNAGDVQDQSGYYRGCSKTSVGVENFCLFLAQTMEFRLNNSEMVGCKTCTTSRCNSGTFNNTNVSSKHTGFDANDGPVTSGLPNVDVGEPIVKTVPGSGKGDAKSRILSGGFFFAWFYFLSKILF